MHWYEYIIYGVMFLGLGAGFWQLDSIAIADKKYKEEQARKKAAAEPDTAPPAVHEDDSVPPAAGV